MPSTATTRQICSATVIDVSNIALKTDSAARAGWKPSATPRVGTSRSARSTLKPATQVCQTDEVACGAATVLLPFSPVICPSQPSGQRAAASRAVTAPARRQRTAQTARLQRISHAPGRAALPQSVATIHAHADSAWRARLDDMNMAHYTELESPPPPPPPPPQQQHGSHDSPSPAQHDIEPASDDAPVELPAPLEELAGRAHSSELRQDVMVAASVMRRLQTQQQPWR